MDASYRSSFAVTIISLVGLISVILSPSRDSIANWALLLGLFSTSFLLSLNLVFRLFQTFKEGHLIFFIIKILNFIFIILSILGMIFGKFLATLSPFFFLPFGYYLFLSFAIIYVFFFEIHELYQLYLKGKIDQVRGSNNTKRSIDDV